MVVPTKFLGLRSGSIQSEILRFVGSYNRALVMLMNLMMPISLGCRPGCGPQSDRAGKTDC
jgi:hypothetical protein